MKDKKLTDKYYNQKEISELLKCTVATVHNYIESGKLKASKLMGHWLVTKTDLESYITKQKKG